MAELPISLRIPRASQVNVDELLSVSAMPMSTVAVWMGEVRRGPITEGGNFVLPPLSLEVDKPGRYHIDIEIDDMGRPHSGGDLPAIVRQGKEYWYWHGVEVPSHVVTNPEKITVSEIQENQNAEVVRVMIERYGQERYLKDCKAKQVAKDASGELYVQKLGRGIEEIKFVKVKNSTAEPDGTFKDYFLRVPPWVGSAKQGVAWTFGLDAKDYQPAKET